MPLVSTECCNFAKLDLLALFFAYRVFYADYMVSAGVVVSELTIMRETTMGEGSGTGAFSPSTVMLMGPKALEWRRCKEASFLSI